MNTLLISCLADTFVRYGM